MDVAVFLWRVVLRSCIVKKFVIAELAMVIRGV